MQRGVPIKGEGHSSKHRAQQDLRHTFAIAHYSKCFQRDTSRSDSNDANGNIVVLDKENPNMATVCTRIPS